MQVLGNIDFPAYIVVNSSTAPKLNYVVVQPGFIESTRLATDSNIYYQIQVINQGVNNITNFYLQYNPNVFSVNPNTNITLTPNQTESYEITLTNPNGTNINDNFYFQSSDNNISLQVPFSLSFTNNSNSSNQIDEYNSSISDTSKYTCTQLLGQICSSSQVCAGESVTSSEGLCCIGEGSLCISSTSTGSSSSYTWVGFLIAGIVIVGIILLFIRYKRVKPDKNPLKKKIEESEKNLKKIP